MAEKEKAEKILDGQKVAQQIKQEVALEVKNLLEVHGVRPCLVAVRVGDDPASAVYVRNKIRTSEALGLKSEDHLLPGDTSTAQLLDLVASLNSRDDVDGILIQLPLPKQIDTIKVIEAVDPAKDVDGFHPVNSGRLMLGQECLPACTPAGIIELLRREGVRIEGRHAVVVGRSNIVGKPMAQMLVAENATVTICHSGTGDLASYTRQADILVVAIGRPGFIRGEYIRRGAIVVDVGMNRVSDERSVKDLFGAQCETRLAVLKEKGFTLVGDVHPKEVEEIASRYTPVPGGVGPLTVACLMRNTIKAARLRRGI
jgi:methylenetetrahydrofolate dehydrogenase (NADP+) / methenyltetrahydrofolate cyclohydrolase